MKLHRSLIVILMLVFLSCMMCGCGDADVATAEADTVFTFGGENVNLGEVFVYANTIIEDYERRYGEDVWTLAVTTEDGTEVSMEDATREDIIKSIIRVKVLYAEAAAYDVSLTETEDAEVREKAASFYDNLTDDQIMEMQLTEEDVTEVLIENAVAEKVYDAIVAEADIEVSFEEARQTTFYDMCFECYREAVNGNITEFSEEDRELQYQRALQAYSTLVDPVNADTENDPESLSQYYGLAYSAYYTLSPEEIADIYGQEVCDMIYTLEDGSYSLVTETEYGYHIFYIKALTDSEATATRKREMEDEMEKTYFTDLYDKWLEDMDGDFSYSDSVNMDVYNLIEF